MNFKKLFLISTIVFCASIYAEQSATYLEDLMPKDDQISTGGVTIKSTTAYKLKITAAKQVTYCFDVNLSSGLNNKTGEFVYYFSVKPQLGCVGDKLFEFYTTNWDDMTSKWTGWKIETVVIPNEPEYRNFKYSYKLDKEPGEIDLKIAIKWSAFYTRDDAIDSGTANIEFENGFITPESYQKYKR